MSPNARQYEMDPDAPDPAPLELRPLFRSWVLQVQCLTRMELDERAQYVADQAGELFGRLAPAQQDEVRGAVEMWLPGALP